MPKRSTKTTKLKKGAWFYSVRGSYLPGSWQGWLTYVPFVAFLGLSVAHAAHGQHTFWDVVFAVIPEWVAAAVAMTWIARAKS